MQKKQKIEEESVSMWKGAGAGGGVDTVGICGGRQGYGCPPPVLIE